MDKDSIRTKFTGTGWYDRFLGKLMAEIAQWNCPGQRGGFGCVPDRTVP